MTEPSATPTPFQDNHWAAITGGLATMLYGRFSGFDSNGMFVAVLLVNLIGYSLGTVWAIANHFFFKREKFVWDKSVKGIFRLLGWFSCFTMTHILKKQAPFLETPLWCLELAILTTECGLVLRKVWEITDVVFLKKAADTMDEVAEIASEKFTQGVESIKKGAK